MKKLLLSLLLLALIPSISAFASYNETIEIDTYGGALQGKDCAVITMDEDKNPFVHVNFSSAFLGEESALKKDCAVEITMDEDKNPFVHVNFSSAFLGEESALKKDCAVITMDEDKNPFVHVNFSSAFLEEECQLNEFKPF